MGGAAGSKPSQNSRRNDEPLIEMTEDVIRRLYYFKSTASVTGPQHLSKPSVSFPQNPAKEEKPWFGSEEQSTIETISAHEMRQQKNLELRANNKVWHEKLRNIERQYIKSENAAGKEFAKQLTKFSAYVPQKSEEMCRNASMKVAQCYKINPTRTLKCSEVVKEFVKCVEG